MATRRIFSLFRGIRTSAQFTAGFSNRVIPSSFISKRDSDFRNNTSRNQRHLILTILFSGQAALFLMDENRFAYAQDDSSNELLSENAQGRGQNQEGYVSDLQRVEDGTVVSNEHTIKWRLFTDNGRDFFSKGKLDEAEKAFELALKEAKLGFGQRDPHVASSCNNLAELKRVRKKFEEAEPLYLEAVSILEESFGPNDVRVGAALHNLGQFYLAQHKLDKARKCYERALKIKGRILGHNNPDYASTVHHLGRVLYMQGKEKDAEALIKESISILEENGLGESLACIRRMTTLSQIMLKSNRPADAEMLQRKILHALELSKDILTKEIIGRGIKRGRLYHLEDMNGGSAHATTGLSISSKNKVLIWHKRLGHPSFGYLKKLFPDLFVNCANYKFECETCIQAKSHRVPYPNSLNKSNSPFELVHSDVWGPSPVISRNRNRWFVLFIDDCTRMTWLYLLKSKDEVAVIFKHFHKMILTQFGKTIKILRSDNGGEFINRDLKVFFQNEGILHETSCAGTPQQNGVAERKNRHILETARSLLFEYNVPQRFWEDAVMTAVYLINRMPSMVLNFQTPLQNLSSFVSIPSCLKLSPKIFGCVAYVHVPKTQRTKIDPCAEKCVFLGYGSQQKGYKCFNPVTKRSYVTMDVTFLETEGYYMANKFHFQEENASENEIVFDEIVFDTTSENNTHFGPKYSPECSPGCQNRTEPDPNPSPTDPPLPNPLLSSTNPDPSLLEASLPLWEEQAADPEILAGPSSIADPNPPEQTIEPTTMARNSENVLKQYSRRKVRELNRGTEDVIQPSPQPQGPAPEDIQEVSNLNSETTNQNLSYRLPYRSNRGKAPDRFDPHKWGSQSTTYSINNFVSTNHLAEPLKGFVANVSSIQIPNSVEEASRDPEWTKAMVVEMEALEKNHTWKLIELPKGKRTVGCKWVFSLKYNASGKIERYKARLVAKGYTQTYGIDFQETFSPVAKLNTIRVLLSLAANLDWPLHQFDVKNAFLHGDLEEEIYMDLPPGYKHPKSKPMVCKLEKSLYGLKQSPRAWFGRFSNAMKSYGYQQSDSDHTLFLKHNQGKITALIIYVDDMVITGNDTSEMENLEGKLSKEFEMKNLGGLKYFLGIEVARSKQGIILSQRKYVLDLLAEVGLLDCKPADTPAVQNLKLGDSSDHAPANQERYQRCLEVRKKILSEDHIQVASTMLHLARLAIYDSKRTPLANGKYSDNTDSLFRAKELLDNSIRITKATLKREKKKTDDIHGAILLYLQALDDAGLLESKKHEMLSPEGTAGYPYEAEHALRECVSIYNEPQTRSILLNAPDAKAQYLTSLNRLSIMIGESADEKTRTKELKDLIETVKHIQDELLPKKNTKKSS